MNILLLFLRSFSQEKAMAMNMVTKNATILQYNNTTSKDALRRMKHDNTT